MIPLLRVGLAITCMCMLMAAPAIAGQPAPIDFPTDSVFQGNVLPAPCGGAVQQIGGCGSVAAIGSVGCVSSYQSVQSFNKCSQNVRDVQRGAIFENQPIRGILRRVIQLPRKLLCGG